MTQPTVPKHWRK